MAEHPVRRLQALDQQAAALRAEREALPEIEALRGHADERAALELRQTGVEERLRAAQADERRLEAEVADAAAKAKSVEDDLYSGRVSASKELEALQAELQACRARQNGLEEQELVLLETVETLTGEAADIEARLGEIEKATRALHGSLQQAEVRIEARLEALEAERSDACAEVEPRLLAAYEKRRDNVLLRGAVTSELSGNHCGVCRTSLPVVEVTRLKAESADAFSVCLSCQRLILR